MVPFRVGDWAVRVIHDVSLLWLVVDIRGYVVRVCFECGIAVVATIGGADVVV